MKVAVIIFHSNVYENYKKSWIDKFIASIEHQTLRDFDILEIDYSQTNICLAKTINKEFKFYNKLMKNHIEAMNFLINEAKRLEYDIILHTNVDDFYNPSRFIQQFNKLNQGYDLVSSNFCYIQEKNEEDKWIKDFNLMSKKDINFELFRRNNIIAHSCIATKISFWENLQYNEALIGYEDLDLWQRALKTKKFFILQDCLLHYRIHEKQITQNSGYKFNTLEKPKVALLIIATGKYMDFLENLLESINTYFLRDCDVEYHIFSDTVKFIGTYPNRTTFHFIEHKPFPYSTLNRYHFFKKYKEELLNYDYYFYIDVDTIIKKPIKKDILTPITVVQHCGHVNERGPYETNPLSSSYVKPDEGSTYFGGGFWGFNYEEFWKMIYTCTLMINKDKNQNIIPIWHDESVLNRYLIDNPPTKILTPAYHYPENVLHIYEKWKKQGLDYKCIILLLNKNHKELRT